MDTGHNLARHLAIPQNDQGEIELTGTAALREDFGTVPMESPKEQSATQKPESFTLAVLALSERDTTTDDKHSGWRQTGLREFTQTGGQFSGSDFRSDLVDGVLVITFCDLRNITANSATQCTGFRPLARVRSRPGAAVSPPVPALETMPS